jgi:hypothetical protein
VVVKRTEIGGKFVQVSAEKMRFELTQSLAQGEREKE